MTGVVPDERALCGPQDGSDSSECKMRLTCSWSSESKRAINGCRDAIN